MNNGIAKLETEQQLVILLSRLTFSEHDNQHLDFLLDEKMDWFKVFRYSIKNKVLPLIWGNIQKKGRQHIVPLRLAQIMNFYMLGTSERNKVYLKEMKAVSIAFEENDIPCIPLKGAYLIPNMYKDLGIRTVNDMDSLISRSDVKKIRSIMHSLGYIEGEYDRKSNSIVHVTRDKAILWQTNMNNLLPFLKVQDSEYAPVTQIDFSFSLDLNLKKEPVEVMISRAKKDSLSCYYHLEYQDFFLHQCCHHYKEASNASWVALNSDLNLIKFCDVREFILHFMIKDELIEAVNFAKEYGLEEAVYFTLFYLKEIYNDGYEEELLQLLNLQDISFLNSYGEKDYGHSVQWKKDFWDRLFSDTNKEELTEEAKYSNIVEF